MFVNWEGMGEIEPRKEERARREEEKINEGEGLL